MAWSWPTMFLCRALANEVASVLRRVGSSTVVGFLIILFLSNSSESREQRVISSSFRLSLHGENFRTSSVLGASRDAVFFVTPAGVLEGTSFEVAFLKPSLQVAPNHQLLTTTFLNEPCAR